MDFEPSESSIKMAGKAFGKIFLTTLFFNTIILLIFSLVFFVFLPSGSKPENWREVLMLANIGILFSSSCVLALGKWISPEYRLPNLLGFLQDQSELKIWPAFSRDEVNAVDYLEKVRSMNTVVSILILIVTVLMLLNHELEKAYKEQAEKEKCSTARTEQAAWATGITVDSDHPLSNEPVPKPREGHPGLIKRVPNTDAQLSPCFRKVMFDMNYFFGLLSFLFGLWTAEILDTAANPYVDRQGMRRGKLKQRFFYHEAFYFGGSGYCYVTIGFFSLLVLSMFSLLLDPLLITGVFILVILFAGIYFYGYYERLCLANGSSIIELRENKSPESDTGWRFGSRWQINLGVSFGTVLVGFVMWGVMYCWFVHLKSEANILIGLYIAFYTFVLGLEIHSPVLLPGLRKLRRLYAP